MNRPLVRNLTLSSLGLVIVGLVLTIVSFAGSTVIPASTDANGNPVAGTGSVTGNNGALLGIGLLLLAVGSIIQLVAYIGALVKTAQIQRWAWFVVILLLSPIALLVYVFAGPDTPPTPPNFPGGYPQGYVPPQGAYGPQGQQQYPPQYPPQQPPPPYQQPPQQQ